LGDEPVQFREVQGNESSMFLALFKKFTVIGGGVASGFRKVEAQEFVPYLLQCTGDKKCIQTYDVTKKKDKVLNKTDCFILDTGDIIYAYKGSKASAWEKRAANQRVQEIKGAIGRGKAHDLHIEGLGDDDEDHKPFWDFVGGKPDEDSMPDAEDCVANDDDFEMKMIKVSDDSGKLKCTEIHKGALLKDKLESDDAFILDTGISIYLWIGKTCKKEEKREAMAHVTQYLKENDRPMNIPVCRVIEGKEPKHFHQMIEDCSDGKWDAKMMKNGFCGRKSSKQVKRD